MDIDDILAEVSNDVGPQNARDLQDLTRMWTAERVAPEILPYPTALMERVLSRIRDQIDLIEEQTGNMDPKTNFQLIIIQTELERFKFLVRSFLRARIAKIDKHQLHYLQNPQHLSVSESEYFPTKLQRLDDTAGGISMVDIPDADAAVFCRALEDSDLITLEGTGVEFEMRKGDIFVVRWSAVRELVLNGQAEVI